MPIRLPVPTPRAGEQIRPMEGIRAWHNANNGFVVAEVHYTADPARRGDWRDRASPKYGGIKSWRWQKEQEINWKAKAGKLIFENWDQDVHVLDIAFTPPARWPRWILVDPGWTNPTSILWVAVDIDSKPNPWGFRPIHVYQEFYQRRRSAQDLAWHAHEMSSPTNPLGVRELDVIEEIILDPGAKQEHQSAAAPEKVDESAATVYDKFAEEVGELGWNVPIKTGNNHKQEAIVELIMRLANYWVTADGVALYDSDDNFRKATDEEILEGAFEAEPTIFFHPTCPHTIREMRQYVWAEWASSEVRDRRNEQEKPVDKDDHSVTNLIRFVNELRRLRGEEGDGLVDGLVDLDDFTPRRELVVVEDPDEIAHRYHERRAARYRKALAGRDTP